MRSARKAWFVIRAALCALLLVAALYSISNLIQGHGYPALAAIHYMIPGTSRWNDRQIFLLDQIFNLVLCCALAYLVAPKRLAQGGEN